jgi:hypothetical protein
MSRPVGSKNKKTNKPVVEKSTDAALVPLTSEAKKLYDEVNERYVLNAVAERLLILACEAMSESARFNAIVQETGRHYENRFGELKPSELSKLELGHRSSAMSCLSKLYQMLG